MAEQTNTKAAVKELLADYRQQTQGGGPLWVAAAKDIVRALEQKTPEDALTFFKQMVKHCGKMTVGSFYEGAVATLKKLCKPTHAQQRRNKPMSYAQAMKWGRSHPKGTRQPIIMSTGSGFWPAHAWLVGNFWPYVERCKAAGIEPMKCEAYYNATVSGGAGDPRLPAPE